MREFAEMTGLEVWYSRMDGPSLVQLVRSQVGSKELPNMEATLARPVLKTA